MVIGIDCSRAFVTDRTGTENYSYHIISEMLRLPTAKKHHFVLFIRPNVVIPDWLRVSYAEVVVIPQRYLWTQFGLAKAVWGRKLDVLWIPAHTLPIIRKPDLKTVVTIHGLEYQWLPEYKNLLQRWYLPLSTYYAANQASKLIAVSQFTKDQLVELGTPEEKITVIYEGVDGLGDVKPGEVKSLAKFGISDSKYILFVGTVQPRKNLVSLIQAFAKVKVRCPDYKLVIAGGKGWMTEAIYQTPAQRGVQESIIFTGRVSDSDLEQLYFQAGLYVQPSLQEGFGLPILEAMKYGVPVVTSDGGALKEVGNGAAEVVKLKASHFESRLADAIERVLGDRQLSSRLITAGLRKVKELTWRKSAQSTLKVLTSSL